MKNCLLLFLIAAASMAVAADPTHNFIDARLTWHEAADDLNRAIERLSGQRNSPRWIGWNVPAVDPADTICCFSNWSDGGKPATCMLDSGHHSYGRNDDLRRPAGEVLVLVRLDDGDVDQVRVYSSNCPLDAEGLPVALLTGVRIKQSVAYLQRLALDADHRVSDEAMMSLAWHAGDSADRALERLTRRDASRQVRKQAAFWLGSARGAYGLAVLKRMLAGEPDHDVLEQVVFGISISAEPESLDLLIRTARRHERSDTRKTALFWLGQKAGDRAVEALGQAIDEDHDSKVREHAVFAVSQLSDGRAIPLLIELARTNRHPEVRKQALFWLGQSGDQRALDLFEEILQN